MDDGEEIEEGDFNFCEAAWFHCKKINYRSSESYEKTYGIIEGWGKKRICIWCSFILRRLVIACFEKCIGIVKERIIYLFVMLGLLKIYMRERRLRIRMLGKDLKDFLVSIRLYQG